MPAQPQPEEHSLPVLLARLIWNLAWLVVPIALPFYLSPPLVIAWWALTHLAEWVENRISGAVDHTFIWMLGGCLGLSALVADRVSPTLTGTLAGIGAFIGLLLVHEGWKRLAGLKLHPGPSGPRLTQTATLAHTGPSAWNGAAPLTPEGEAVRVLYCSEFVMGGPAVCDYLLPDGSVICGAGASSGFSPNGRYFVSPAPSRGEWPLLIYDQHTCMLHQCDVQSRFWEIDLVGDLSITGRESPLVCNASWTAMIDDLIAHSQHQPMVQVADLKIPQAHWQHLCQRHARPFPGTREDGPSRIHWQLHLPASLAALDDPLAELSDPMVEIMVGHEPSGLLVRMSLAEVVWRDDGQAMVCRAKHRDTGAGSAWWLWDEPQGWQRVIGDAFLDVQIQAFDAHGLHFTHATDGHHRQTTIIPTKCPPHANLMD